MFGKLFPSGSRAVSKWFPIQTCPKTVWRVVRGLVGGFVPPKLSGGLSAGGLFDWTQNMKTCVYAELPLSNHDDEDDDHHDEDNYRHRSHPGKTPDSFSCYLTTGGPGA